MILSFNERFRESILSGRKIHTIREAPLNPPKGGLKERWREGVKIHFATGVRTKQYEQFHAGTCTGTQTIEIKYTEMRGAVEIYIDGRHFGTWHRFMQQKSVNPERILQLAINDGFEGVTDFLDWFKRDFKGRIIHWTGFKY